VTGNNNGTIEFLMPRLPQRPFYPIDGIPLMAMKAQISPNVPWVYPITYSRQSLTWIYLFLGNPVATRLCPP
jgi:hypothetical protein